MSFVTTWERFWFREVPPEIFALLRIAFGALGLLHVIGLTPVSMLWGLDGVMRVPGGGLGVKAALLDSSVGHMIGPGLFMMLALAFAAMMLGIRTAVAVAAAFAGCIAQAYWNPLPRHGADDVLVVVLFCLLWADCGRRFSFDAWRARRSGAELTNDGLQPVWPLRLLQVQVAVIYLNSGLWKLLGNVWRDGSAIEYALEYNLLHRFPVDLPPALTPILTIVTFVTLVWELGFAFMMLHRLSRWIALIVGVLVHGGIWILLDIGVFSWLMIASYLAFLDPERITEFFTRWRVNRRVHAALPIAADS